MKKKINKRTFKQDRELAVKLAENLGHEMKPWGRWFGQRRGIAFCDLCNDWIGLKSERNWEYNKDLHYAAGITGTAIEEDYKWRIRRCSGIRFRAKYRAIWTRRYKKTLAIIKNNSEDEAAIILCGEKD